MSATATTTTDVFEAARAAGLVCVDPCWGPLLERIDAFAWTDHPLAFLGKSGVGKSQLARFAHLRSRRAAAPLVITEATQLRGEGAGSDLFGHVRGAYTGALIARKGLFVEADGGTLFIDEIGDLDPTVQGRLLDVVQRGAFRPIGSDRVTTVSVRLIVATLRSLDALRDDLRYRLAKHVVHVPDLVDRPADIEPLALHVLARENEDRETWGGAAVELTPSALAWLHTYDWPGNVRELDNAITSAVARAGKAGRDVTASDIYEEVAAAAPNADDVPAANDDRDRVRVASLETGTRTAEAAAKVMELVRLLQKTSGGLRASELEAMTGIPRRTCDYHLRRLVDDGVLRKRGPRFFHPGHAAE